MRTQFRLAAMACAMAMMVGPALADKPTWVDDENGKPPKSANGNSNGNSNGNGNGKPSNAAGNDKSSNAAHGPASTESHSSSVDISLNAYFGDHDRSILHEYYADEFRSGHCPPGLAKKHNGCMPPGQAKKWAIGHRLPDDLIYYDLPLEILRQLRRAPDGYKYVRVAADVLLIAVGTGIVMDAIEDLSGM